MLTSDDESTPKLLHAPLTWCVWGRDHVTNSTTGNPLAIYFHFFTQFATNISKLDPCVGPYHLALPVLSCCHIAVLEALTPSC